MQEARGQAAPAEEAGETPLSPPSVTPRAAVLQKPKI